jgi:hypothetical protein
MNDLARGTRQLKQLKPLRLGSAVLLAAALAVSLVLAGCSSSDDDPPKPSTTSAGSPTANGGGGTAAPTAAGSAPASPVGPIVAEQKNLPMPNRTGDTMSVAVRSLSVDPNGTTMTLRLVFTPQFASKPDVNITLADLAPGSYLRPSLLDRVHLKRYDVIAAADRNGFLESDAGTGAPNGVPFEAWFVYAAPQDQISTLEVSVLDSWPPFVDVPVRR